jgi:hypothetical protein
MLAAAEARFLLAHKALVALVVVAQRMVQPETMALLILVVALVVVAAQVVLAVQVS